MTSVRERLGFAGGAIVAIVIFAMLAWGMPTGSDQPSSLARGGPVAAATPETEAESDADEDPNEEAAEQAEGTQERLEALEKATREGKAGQAGKRTYITAVGGNTNAGGGTSAGGGTGTAAAAAAGAWVGEVPADPFADDWEPAIAADPAAPYVYVLTTRYGAKPCSGNCPSPFIALLVSSNGGASFAAAKALCACKGSGQFDPIIEVVPNTGAVYALYMNGFNVMFTK